MKKAIITILLALAIAVLDYLATVGIYWLITLCFGLDFSWLIATGVALVLWLIGVTFRGGSK